MRSYHSKNIRPGELKKANRVFDFLKGFVLSIIITIKEEEGLWQKTWRAQRVTKT
jgi:hypothetical protein